MYQTTKQIMEKDILNYSPTVLFRGTPCILHSYRLHKYYLHLDKLHSYRMRKYYLQLDKLIPTVASA